MQMQGNIRRGRPKNRWLDNIRADMKEYNMTEEMAENQSMWHIYTITLIKSVCLSVLANGRSQFLLDRLGRCLKLSVSTESTSSHKFVSQFGLAFFYTRKTPKNYREDRPALKCLLNEEGRNADTVDRSPTTSRTGKNTSG